MNASLLSRQRNPAEVSFGRAGLIALVVLAHAALFWSAPVWRPPQALQKLQHIELVKSLPPERRSPPPLLALAQAPALPLPPPPNAITVPAIKYETGDAPAEPTDPCQVPDNRTQPAKPCPIIVLPTLRDVFSSLPPMERGSVDPGTLKRLAVRFGKPAPRPTPSFEADRAPLIPSESWQKTENWKEEFKSDKPLLGVSQGGGN